ncbi:DUF6577 family protein [Emticicia oligotrophica]|uniref:DUF6577 family protein n=1 Tax=Emticicia oligotrophica TaxID=312279 RepID=UPI00273B82D1|nr:DUF6577 family protein [Emticicia oligotrophica]
MSQYQIHNQDLAALFTTRTEVAMADIDKFLKERFKINNSKVSYLRYKLVKEGFLERTGYKTYSIRKNRIVYAPDLNDTTKEIFATIKEAKPYLNTCVWRTSILNEFTRHQVGKFMIMVEVERVGIEAVFDVLRDKYSNVFLTPTDKEIDFYISALDEAIVIVPLVSEAPTQVIDGIETITIEKVLVDILTDDKLYQTFQSERSRIIHEANTKYIINKNTLLRYAGRRKKREFIEQKIQSVIAQEYIEK